MEDDGDVLMESVHPPVFMMLGHGKENLVHPSERPILPADTILVTVVECSTSSPLERPGQLLEYLRVHPEYAADPIRFKAAIEGGVGFHIRIYRPGDRYPDLMYTPFALQEAINTIYLSGIVPLNRVLPVHARLMMDGIHYEDGADRDELLRTSFEISDYPTVESIIANQAILSDWKSVTSIMQDLGPGVYYFPLCRDVNEGTNPEHIQIVRSYSSGIQSTRGAKRSTKGYRTRRKLRGKKVRTQKRLVARPTTITRRRKILPRGRFASKI